MIYYKDRHSNTNLSIIKSIEMQKLILPTDFIPSIFYMSFVFTSESSLESQEVLDKINISLNNLIKTDYRNSLSKTFKNNNFKSTIILNGSVSLIFKTINNPDRSVTNFIFIVEDDILKAASYSGNTEGSLYVNKINYKKFLFNEFKKQFSNIAEIQPQLCLI